MRNRAIAPSGTTFSMPVKAVPPGVTVVGFTSTGVVELDGTTVVPCTVDVGVVEVAEVVVMVEVGVVEVAEVELAVVPVVELVEVAVVELVEVAVVVAVVELVVVAVVELVVLVEVVPAVQCEIVRCGVGTGPESSQVQLATALVFAAFVFGPGTSRLKLLPPGVIGPELPFTFKVTLLTWLAACPNPVRIQSVVPLQGTKLAPFTWFHVVVCGLANAAVGKIAHAIMSKVAADRAIRPAVVSRRPCLFLRAGIPYLPTRVDL